MLAHELGHNFGLVHAPGCGAQQTDSRYPYAGGAAGVWGYDLKDDRLMPPTISDLMAYCWPAWLSDYFYRKALLNREERESVSVPRARQQRVLVIWGSTGPNGIPILEPSFYTDGSPAPITGDTQEITGLDAGGNVAFTYRFSPLYMANGGSSFVHLIPITWGGDLSMITLIGESGEARLDTNTDRPVSIVIRDGQVRSVAYAMPSRQDSGLIFSRGIPRR